MEPFPGPIYTDDKLDLGKGESHGENLNPHIQPSPEELKQPTMGVTTEDLNENESPISVEPISWWPPQGYSPCMSRNDIGIGPFPSLPTPRQVKQPTMAMTGQDSRKGITNFEPILFSHTEGHSAHESESDKVQQNTPTKGVKRQSSIIVREGEGLGFDLNLTDDKIAQILKGDEERLAKTKNIEEMSPRISQLSFYDRLNGWSHNVRQRHDKGRCDKYYYHKNSNNMLFRSVAEVKRFICDGIYPQKPQPKKNKTSVDESSPLDCKASQETFQKREKLDQGFNSAANASTETEKHIGDKQEGAEMESNIQSSPNYQPAKDQPNTPNIPENDIAFL